MFLYVITNAVNGKRYVGITANPDQRKREHYSGHGSKLVWQAIKKYGEDNLQFEVWYEYDEDWITRMEYRAIVTLETQAPLGYNLTLGGEGSRGWKPSEETREKFRRRRNGMLGRKHSEETRQVISDKAKARVLTPERQSLLKSLAGSGSMNPNAKPVVINGVQYGCIKDAAEALGVSRSVVARLRNKGASTCAAFDRVAHGRACGKLSCGRKLSAETRMRMSEARRGAKSAHARPVVVGGIKYGCLKDAAVAHRVNYSTLRTRFQKWSRSGVFPDGFGYCRQPE